MVKLKDVRGVTLVELLIVMVVISILASVVTPMLRISVKRAKEYELKRDLMTMRDAIDEYKRFVDNGWVAKDTESGYPKSLDMLVEGVELKTRTVQPGQTDWNPPGQLPQKYKFLRRIPVDPMTGAGEWKYLSNEDVAGESLIESGADVYDVRSLSEGTALDGTRYSEW